MQQQDINALVRTQVLDNHQNGATAEQLFETFFKIAKQLYLKENPTASGKHLLQLRYVMEKKVGARLRQIELDVSRKLAELNSSYSGPAPRPQDDCLEKATSQDVRELSPSENYRTLQLNSLRIHRNVSENPAPDTICESLLLTEGRMLTPHTHYAVTESDNIDQLELTSVHRIVYNMAHTGAVNPYHVLRKLVQRGRRFRKDLPEYPTDEYLHQLAHELKSRTHGIGSKKDDDVSLFYLQEVRLAEVFANFIKKEPPPPDIREDDLNDFLLALAAPSDDHPVYIGHRVRLNSLVEILLLVE